MAQIGDHRGLLADGRASGQVYQIAGFVRSPCHRDGGLTCTDCHDPHGPGLLPFAEPDAMCTRCHASEASREHTFHAPAGPGARCVECHMPRVLSGLTSHQRDHRISVPLPALPDAPDACTACHRDRTKDWAAAETRRLWGDPPAATLEAARGIALARGNDAAAKPLLEKALSHPDPFFRANAALYLRGDGASLVADPVPEVRLAAVRAAALGTDRAKAVANLEGFLVDAEPRVRAEAEVALALLGRDPDPAWRPDLEAAIRLDRGLSEARLVLAWLERKAGEPARAAESLRLAITFAPDLDDAWVALADVLDALSRRAEAARVRSRRADRLVSAHRARPGAADAAARAAAACVAAGRLAAARRALHLARERLPSGLARTRIDELLRRLEERVGGSEDGP